MSSPQDPKKSSAYIALKYSGIAFELLVFILVAVWIGGKLDAHFGLEDRYITVGLVFLAAFGFFFRLVRQVSSDQ